MGEIEELDRDRLALVAGELASALRKGVGPPPGDPLCVLWAEVVEELVRRLPEGEEPSTGPGSLGLRRRFGAFKSIQRER